MSTKFQKELKEIHDFARKGATFFEFWEFLLRSTPHQEAWIASSPEKEIEIKIWDFLMGFQRKKYIEKWYKKNPEANPLQADWQEVFEKCPKTVRRSILNVIESYKNLSPAQAQKIFPIFLEDKDEVIRKKAVQLVKNYEKDPEKNLELLLKSLRDPSTDVKLQAIESLRQYTSKRIKATERTKIIDALLALIQSPYSLRERWVQEESFILLAKLKISLPKIFPFFRTTLQDHSVDSNAILGLLIDMIKSRTKEAQQLLPELLGIFEIKMNYLYNNILTEYKSALQKVYQAQKSPEKILSLLQEHHQQFTSEKIRIALLDILIEVSDLSLVALFPFLEQRYQEGPPVQKFQILVILNQNPEILAPSLQTKIKSKKKAPVSKKVTQISPIFQKVLLLTQDALKSEENLDQMYGYLLSIKIYAGTELQQEKIQEALSHSDSNIRHKTLEYLLEYPQFIPENIEALKNNLKDRNIYCREMTVDCLKAVKATIPGELKESKETEKEKQASLKKKFEKALTLKNPTEEILEEALNIFTCSKPFSIKILFQIFQKFPEQHPEIASKILTTLSKSEPDLYRDSFSQYEKEFVQYFSQSPNFELYFIKLLKVSEEINLKGIGTSIAYFLGSEITLLPDALPILKNIFETENEKIQISILQGVLLYVKIEDEKISELIEILSKKQHKGIRAHLLFFLHHHCLRLAKRFVPFLMDALKEQSTQAEAAAILSEIKIEGHKEIVAPLLEILPQLAPEDQSKIIKVLGNFKEHAQKISPFLLEMVQKPKDQNIFLRSIEAIGKMGQDSEEMINILKQHHQNPRKEIREKVIEALGRLSVEKYPSLLLPVFKEGLGDRSKMVRKKSIEALGKMKSNPKAIDLICSAYDDELHEVRAKSIDTLKKLKRNPKSLAIFCKALQENEPVWSKAVDALKKLATKEDEFVLVALKNYKKTTSHSGKIQKIKEALQKIEKR